MNGSWLVEELAKFPDGPAGCGEVALGWVFVYLELQCDRVNCVDKKNQLDVTICILYFSSNSCSTCFGQPCAHHQELTTA